MSRPPPLTVTDHAVLRELERLHGIDVEGVRREIRRKVRNGLELGAVGVLVDGLRYVLRDGRVVTVLDGPRSREVEARRASSEQGGDHG